MDDSKPMNESAAPGAGAGLAGGEGDHPGLERLLAYRDGELTDEAADALQEHLSLCADCALLLLEFDQFRADAAAGERGPSEGLRRDAWDGLQVELRQERLARGAGGAPPAALLAAPRRWAPSWTVLALAAALALTVLGLVFVARQGQVQRQAEQAELEAARQEAAELRARLEAAQAGSAETPKGSGDPTGATAGRQTPAPRTPSPLPTPTPILAHRPPSEISPLPPVAISAIAVAVGPWLTVRGEGHNVPLRLEGEGKGNVLTPDENGRILIGFDLGPALKAPNVHLQLLDADGKILWAGEKASQVIDGDLGTAAALTGLKPGRYRLRAEGGGGEAGVEYVLEVGGR